MQVHVSENYNIFLAQKIKPLINMYKSESDTKKIKLKVKSKVENHEFLWSMTDWLIIYQADLGKC